LYYLRNIKTRLLEPAFSDAEILTFMGKALSYKARDATDKAWGKKGSINDTLDKAISQG
jgi:hypothetical protein